MKMGNALITGISEAENTWGHVRAAILEDLKVMSASLSKSGGENFPVLRVDYELGFLGVPLLFAAVMAFLLFLGRSMGCSVASTKTTSIWRPLACKVFLPGNVN